MNRSSRTSTRSRGPGWTLLAGLLLWSAVLNAQTDVTVPAVTYLAATTTVVTAPQNLGTVSGDAVVVEAGATVTYKAGTSITLRQGFRATAGSSFRAHIGDVPAGSTYSLLVNLGSGSASGLLPGAVRTIVANNPPPGGAFLRWVLASGSGTFADQNASTTTFTMVAADAIVSARFNATSSGVDSDGDGVTDTVEVELGLDPSDPSDTRVYRYEYDKTGQLIEGPGGEYKMDEESNIKEVQP